MKIEVGILPREAVLRNGYSVQVAPRGTTWSASPLGPQAKDRGVYVIHHAGRVKYVGKTDALNMSFGMRLRREFQETASQGRHIYPKLAALNVPPAIQVYLLPAEKIRELVSTIDITLTDAQHIPIYETVLIQLYQPDFQL
jgi:hypothetical protein